MNEPITNSGKSILRAVSVLDSVSKGTKSLTDIAATCQLNKATVHRLLKVLERANLVRQDPVNRQYLLGRFFTRFVIAPFVIHDYLLRISDSEMKQLAEATQETTHLDILIGTYDVILKSIPTTHALRIVEETRESDYLHAGATGQVLLSQLDTKDLRIALKYMDFKPFAQKTIIDSGELSQRIKQIRKQGYAVSFGERVDGVIAVSVPIFNYEVPAALSVLGPEDRLKPKIKDILGEVQKSCSRISQALIETRAVRGE